MKLFVKLMIFVLVLGFSGLFVMKRPDGRPWLDASEFMPDVSAAQRLIAKVQRMVSNIGGSDAGDTEAQLQAEPFGHTKVYRWKDENGFWQLSDTPPSGGKADVMFINPDTNLIQGLRKTPEPTAEESVDGEELPSGMPLPLTISPKQLSKLMKDAKNVQETLNQRNRDLEAISSGRKPDER